MSPATPVVTCESLLEQISGYLDGELGAPVCKAIEAHAASCPNCGEVIEEFRKTTGLCRRVADAPLPASVRALARQRVRELLRGPRRG
ncbi:MAG: anti-sigma factor [Vicinamibacterales bacterium]